MRLSAFALPAAMKGCFSPSSFGGFQVLLFDMPNLFLVVNFKELAMPFGQIPSLVQAYSIPHLTFVPQGEL